MNEGKEKVIINEAFISEADSYTKESELNDMKQHADKIIQGIKDVWASPYTERSFKWRQKYLNR